MDTKLARHSDQFNLGYRAGYAECTNPHISQRDREIMYRAMTTKNAKHDPMERHDDRQFRLGRMAAYDVMGVIPAAPADGVTRYAVAYRDGHGDPWNADPWCFEFFTTDDEATAFVERSMADADYRTANLTIDADEHSVDAYTIRTMTDDELDAQQDKYRNALPELYDDPNDPTTRAVLMAAYHWAACAKESARRYVSAQPRAKAHRLATHAQCLGVDLSVIVNLYPEVLSL